jgi:RHS repeat-associated protein
MGCLGRPNAIDSVTMTYDALGRMVEQNRSGAYTQFVYSPTGFKMQIMNGQAPPIKSLVPLPAGGQAVYSATALLYYGHPDHLGSTCFASTPSRTMYYDGAYAPFGEPYAQSGTADLSFTGQRQDTVSGLYDFPAREYSIQGRWPSPDPAGLAAVDPSNPQSWNRYAYVMNNPLALIDPDGLDPCQGANNFAFSQAANGTGIFTQDDCLASGGTWDGIAGITIITPPTYVTEDSLPAPWGPNLSGLLSDSSGGGNSSSSGHSSIRGVVGTVLGIAKGVVCTATAPLVQMAQMNGGATGIGGGGSVGIGLLAGLAVQGGVQVVADPHGRVGISISFGGNPGFAVLGAGALAGIQYTRSTGNTIFDLGGAANSLGVTGALTGVGIGIDAAGSSTADTLTLTVGAGVGGKGAAYARTGTWVPSWLSTDCGPK